LESIALLIKFATNRQLAQVFFALQVTIRMRTKQVDKCMFEKPAALSLFKIALRSTVFVTQSLKTCDQGDHRMARSRQMSKADKIQNRKPLPRKFELIAVLSSVRGFKTKTVFLEKLCCFQILCCFAFDN